MGGQILVVEENATIRRVISSMLRLRGFEPHEAFDADSALEMLRAQPFELALIDRVVAGRDSAELCQRLRGSPLGRSLPLVITGAAEVGLQPAAQKLHAVPLPRPFGVDALIEAMGEAEEVARAVSQPRPAISRSPSGVGPLSARGPASARASHPDLAAPSSRGSSPGLGSRSASSPGLTPARGTPGHDQTSPSLLAPDPALLAAEAPAAPAPMTPQELARLLHLALEHLGGQGWYGASDIEQAAESALGLRETPPPSSAREVLRGAADAVPLGELMQVLQMQMQTGVLEVRKEQGTEVRVFFRNGLIDLVSARGASGEFLMGRYLLELGFVDAATLDAALDVSRSTGQLLGDVLVEQGLLSRDQLTEALVRQSSELIYELLRWNEARYVFLRGEVKHRGLGAELGLPVASLVMEGFRRVDEWRLIEENLPPHVVLLRDDGAIDRMGKGRLGRLERVLLDAIDGARSVREILDEASASSFEGSKILYQFLQSRLVRRRSS